MACRRRHSTIEHGRITAIDVVRNPDTLKHLD
jgi:hypothetical protein